jgi:hypothetical protein
VKEGGSSNASAANAVELTGAFFLRITPERFEIFAQAEARVVALGLNGSAVGLIIIDARTTVPGAPPGEQGVPGIAMALNLELSLGDPEGGDQTSALSGIFELRGSVTVAMNTTLREQVFDIPQAFLELMPRDAPTRIPVHKSAPDINGNERPNAPAEIYVFAVGPGQHRAVRHDHARRDHRLHRVSDVNGNAFVRIAGAVSANIEFLGALSGSMDLQFYSNLNGEAGIIGRVQLARTLGGDWLPGITLSGQFLLEVNSFASAKTISTFVTNKELDPAYSGSQPNILALDINNKFVFDDVTLQPGLRLVLQGELKLGAVVEISGRFEFLIGPTALEIRAAATMKLLKVGEFNVDGVFRVGDDGFAAYIDVSLGGFGADIGLSFNAAATLQIYIGTLPEKVLTKVDGSEVTVKAASSSTSAARSRSSASRRHRAAQRSRSQPTSSRSNSISP